MLKQTYKIPSLPPHENLETTAVLKALSAAHRPLAELKGLAKSIPNQAILINTLTLQEARASSEIENIVTTQDDLFRIDFSKSIFPTPEAKEVALYGTALHAGHNSLLDRGGISLNALIDMFRILKNTDGGFRKNPGTALKNESTGEIVFVPPQDPNAVRTHMEELEIFINSTDHDDLDPLTRLAIIHHQFESIHPFPDGNGRIGRILNALFLVHQDLLEIPILYISRFITQNKSLYYELLQHTRDTGEWEPWLLYMIEAVRVTSESTIIMVSGLRDLMSEYKNTIKSNHGFYSHELINNLFKHPYTRIDYVVDEVGVTRQTAGNYLDELSEAGLLEKYKSGRNNYYINTRLVELLLRLHESP